jgi:hypothetical protein
MNLRILEFRKFFKFKNLRDLELRIECFCKTHDCST